MAAALLLGGLASTRIFGKKFSEVWGRVPHRARPRPLSGGCLRRPARDQIGDCRRHSGRTWRRRAWSGHPVGRTRQSRRATRVAPPRIAYSPIGRGGPALDRLGPPAWRCARQRRDKRSPKLFFRERPLSPFSSSSRSRCPRSRSRAGQHARTLKNASKVNGLAR